MLYSMNVRRDGFTLIELMITLVVMVALMSLGVAAISNLQAQGRDKEREEDMAIIARGLEAYYNNGNPKVADRKGTYPNGAELDAIISNNYLGDALPGVSTQSITAPNKTAAEFFNAGSDTSTDVDTALASGKYVYIPYVNAIDTPTSIATTGTPPPVAVRYVLKYKKEIGGDIVTLESKHQ